MPKSPSREQWEQDVRDVQRGVLPDEEIRQLQILSRRVPPGTALLKTARQLRDLLIGLFLFGFGVLATVASILQRETYPAIANVGVGAGILLCVLAFLLMLSSFTVPRRL